MNIEWKFQRILEALSPNDLHVQIGLREDGVVVWRELIYDHLSHRYIPPPDTLNNE